jgi:hypothetical protein
MTAGVPRSCSMPVLAPGCFNLSAVIDQIACCFLYRDTGLIPCCQDGMPADQEACQSATAEAQVPQARHVSSIPINARTRKKVTSSSQRVPIGAWIYFMRRLRIHNSQEIGMQRIHGSGETRTQSHHRPMKLGAGVSAILL